mmetsp:Transcript_3933/g.4019  ORF Transcript_3933/g.4019 Transcript_3933/m.4019 type:complete len:96 (+) Transcript_3933:1-288(+)
MVEMSPHISSCYNLSPSLPLDPVARYHLRNGASLFRLNWLANPSQSGLSSSAGLMVNYLYERDLIVMERKASEFVTTRGKVPISESIKHILQEKD